MKTQSQERRESIKPMFIRLYQDEDRPLTEVSSYLAQEHEFIASPKMYKNQIRRWGIEKNLRERQYARSVEAECIWQRSTPTLGKRELKHTAAFHDLTDGMNDHFGPTEVRCFTPAPGDFEIIDLELWRQPSDLADHSSLRRVLSSMSLCTEEFWVSTLSRSAWRSYRRFRWRLKDRRSRHWSHMNSWKAAFEQILTPPDVLPLMDIVLCQERRHFSPSEIGEASGKLKSLVCTHAFLVLDHVIRVHPFIVTEQSRRVYWYVLSYMKQLSSLLLPGTHPFRIILDGCLADNLLLADAIERMRDVHEQGRSAIVKSDIHQWHLCKFLESSCAATAAQTKKEIIFTDAYASTHVIWEQIRMRRMDSHDQRVTEGSPVTETTALPSKMYEYLNQGVELGQLEPQPFSNARILSELHRSAQVTLKRQGCHLWLRQTTDQ